MPVVLRLVDTKHEKTSNQIDGRMHSVVASNNDLNRDFATLTRDGRVSRNVMSNVSYVIAYSVGVRDDIRAFHNAFMDGHVVKDPESTNLKETEVIVDGRSVSFKEIRAKMKKQRKLAKAVRAITLAQRTPFLDKHEERFPNLTRIVSVTSPLSLTFALETTWSNSGNRAVVYALAPLEIVTAFTTARSVFSPIVKIRANRAQKKLGEMVEEMQQFDKKLATISARRN